MLFENMTISADDIQKGELRLNLEFEDVEYLDGYFFDPRGTNSVVHFHINKCPGWKFGIWWDPIKKEKEFIIVSGKFFTQYEETCDKFKPSRSLAEDICITIPRSNVNRSYKGEFSLEDIVIDSWRSLKLVNFIHNEPELAFCRDYCFWDYNYEYHSRKEAKDEYCKWRFDKDRKDKYTEELDQRVYSYIEENLLPLFKDAFITDDKNCSPRFDLIAPFENNKDLVSEPGLYCLFEIKDFMKYKEEFDNFIKSCEDYADEKNICWYSPINTWIEISDNTEFLKYNKKK